MKKKILAVMLCFAFLFSIFPMNAIVNAANGNASVTYKVEAVEKEVYPGDTINFKIKLQQTSKISMVDMKVRIPDGLTFIDGSAKVDKGKTVLGWNDFSATEPSASITKDILQFAGIDVDKIFTGTTEVEIASFQCKVNENAALKEYSVELYDEDASDEGYAAITNITTVPAKVTVKQKPVPATGVTLDKNTLTLNAGSDGTLTPTLTPANTTDIVTWSSSNTTVATVSGNNQSATVHAVAKGTTTITATINGKTATCAVTVECAHTNKTEVSAKTSTCKEQGNITYKTCNACGAIFNTNDIQITLEQTKLPYAAHTYGSEIPEVATTHSNKTATAGTKAHYECSVCHKLFIEKNGNKEEVGADALVIPAPNHTYSDWKTDGTNHWKECTVCTLEAEKEAHKGEVTRENEVAPKCEEKGHYDEVTKCTVCKKVLKTEQKEIVAKGHTAKAPVRENVIDSTCQAEGSYDEVTYCKDCNKEIKREQKTIEKKPHEGAEWNTDDDYHWKNCQSVGCGTIIEKARHTAGEAVKEKIEPATCEEEGSYEEVTYCTVCKKELSRTPKTEVATGHTAGEAVKENIKPATCEAKGSYDEVTYCKDCNKKLKTEKKEIPATGHTEGTPVKENVIESTAKKEGSYDEVIYCTKCDKELSREKKTTPKFVYEMLEGMDGKYQYEDEEGLTFKANGDFNKFILAKVDGKEVDENNYTVKSGSTIITLKPTYLDTLSEGKHTLLLAYEDGEIETEFTVYPKEDNNEENQNDNSNIGDNGNEDNNKNTNKETPETGDNSNIALFISGLLVSGICFIIVLKWKTKNQRIRKNRQ